MIIKVLTFNLQTDHPDYFNKLPKVIELIKKEDANIVALQEVRYGSYRTIINELVRYGYNYILNEKIEYHRLYGEIIFTKQKILDHVYIPFIESSNMRGLTAYRTDKYIVATTHLDHGKQGEKQTKIINDYFKSISEPFIILGDFNYFEDTQGTQGIEGTKEVPSINTFKDDKYNSRPDRIYYNKFEFVSSIVKDEGLSDHSALISYFTLNE